ncbi:MAG: Gfo/Idh/MocA family oxidoreductase [Defluviitaleaceae bacterium]|nr:Gfo/Idh/MocA family oxidoreductase [Defluviitaleaceae bacterium]
MRISVFTDELFMDASKAMPIIASWGCETVDFRGSVNGKGIEYQTDEELRALKARLDSLGLVSGVLQSSLCKKHLPGADIMLMEMEKLEGLIRASEILGARLVRSFNCWQPPGDLIGALATRPDMMQRVLDLFSPVAKRAKEAGLIFGFENCGQTAGEVIALLDALGVPEWGMAWDVSNHWEIVPDIEDESKQTEYIIKCLKRSNMIHVKATSVLPELSGVKIDWPRILAGVGALGQSEMPVSIETHNPKESPFGHEEATRLAYRAIVASAPKAAPGSLEEAVAVRRVFVRTYENNPVSFVVMGMGMGYGRAGQIVKTPGARLAGVVDIVPGKAKAAGEHYGVPWDADPRVFLDDPRVEVMYVVTPTGTHCEIARRCMEAGKHVLTTKPMDANAAACEEAIKVAKQRGLLFGVDFDKRNDRETLSLREANRTGFFGRLLSATVLLKILRTQEYYDENGAWRGTKRLDGGGAMSNQGIHEIDRLIFALGMPKRVTGYAATQTHAIEAEDLGFGAWEFEGGAVANFYATTSYPFNTWYSRIEIHGTSGAYISEVGGAGEARERWFKEGEWSGTAPVRIEPEYAHAADNMASAVRLGVPLSCPGEDGIRSRVVLDAMYESAARDGAWVEIKKI